MRRIYKTKVHLYDKLLTLYELGHKTWNMLDQNNEHPLVTVGRNENRHGSYNLRRIIALQKSFLNERVTHVFIAYKWNRHRVSGNGP